MAATGFIANSTLDASAPPVSPWSSLGQERPKNLKMTKPQSHQPENPLRLSCKAKL